MNEVYIGDCSQLNWVVRARLLAQVLGLIHFVRNVIRILTLLVGS